MDEYREACGGLTMSIIIPILVGVLGFFLGILSPEMRSRFSKWLGTEKGTLLCFQKDIMEIKKTTIQIAQDWIEMTKLITGIQCDQANFADLIQSELDNKSEKLRHNISVCLEDEFLRNDQRFSKMKRTIEGMQEDILSMRHYLQSLTQKSVRMFSTDASHEKKVWHTMDSSAQTEYEIKRRARDGHNKNGTNTEYEASKLISTVKKCLTDLMKDAKLHLSIDREEENRELQIIFSKLAEDRDDIKKTIVQAFSIAADQAKKNFDQFGHVGQDAMHYIAVLNEKTNTMLKSKLKETDDRLKEILNALNRQTFDVVAIRETLENIDGQFDDIFQRVELGCQRNTEHCEEMAQSLERASNNWEGTALELQRMSKGFSDDTKKLKEMLKEMKNLIDSTQQKYIDNLEENNKGENEIMQYDTIASTTTQNLRIFSQKQRNLIFMYSTIQSCLEKMTCMNSRVENGCESICNLIETLEQKLLSLNEAVEKLDDVLRNVDLENLMSHITCTKCHDANSEEIIETMLKTIPGDAGDGQPQILRTIKSNHLTNVTFSQKIQNAIAINKEVKMIELILRKVCEKRNSCQNDRKLIIFPSIQDNTAHITKESQSLITDERKPDGQMKLEENDADNLEGRNENTRDNNNGLQQRKKLEFGDNLS